MCFPMKILKSNKANSDTDVDLITINNLFAHIVKEIGITRYGYDKQLIPTFWPYEIYQYSDSMLKHLAKNSFKKLKKLPSKNRF